MSLAEKFVKMMIPITYPFIYLGEWNKDKVIKNVDGCKVKLRVWTSDKYVLWEIFNKKVYTSDNDFKIKPSDIVVDIGGHMGAFSVLTAKKAKQVYVYEALKDNYDLLNENIKLNNLNNVKSFNLAVSDRVGQESFFLGGRNFTVNSLYRTGYSCKQIEVSTTNLEKVFSDNNLKRISFLKIDVEGAEYKILMNTPPEILKNIDRIVLEFHESVENGHSYKELVSLLEKSGFEVSILPVSYLDRKLFKIGLLKAIRRC